MNKVKELKLEIIEELMMVNNLWLLSSLKEKLVEGKRAARDEKVPAFMEAAIVLRDDVSFDEIVKEQNRKPLNYDEVKAILNPIEWTESVDELLEELD